MKLCTLVLAALLAASALSAQAQDAPVAAAAASRATAESRINGMIDSALRGYNGSTVATATCLIAVRHAGSGGAASDKMGLAVAGLLKTDAPVVVWEHDGALNGALIFFNFTSRSPVGDARSACRTIQAGLPAKLRSGAVVTTNTFRYVYDPSKPAKKGACSNLCYRYCNRNDWRCKGLCTAGGWSCKAICRYLRLPNFICMWL